MSDWRNRAVKVEPDPTAAPAEERSPQSGNWRDNAVSVSPRSPQGEVEPESDNPILRGADAVTDTIASGFDKTMAGGTEALRQKFHIPPEAFQALSKLVQKPLGYLGGIGSTATVEAVKALAGKGSMAPVADAILGDAKSMPQQLMDSGWNRSLARVVGVPGQMVTDPLVLLGELASAGKLGELGNGLRGKLVKNAFAPVDQAFGELKPYQNRLEETPFSDQILKNNVITPGKPGKMRQQLRNVLDKDLGGSYNQIWENNEGVKTSPEQVFEHPRFKEWAKRTSEDSAGEEAVEAVKDQVRREHKKQTMEPLPPEAAKAMQEVNKHLEAQHIEKKRAEWRPDANSLEHQEFNPAAAAADFQPPEIPDEVPKADPGMNPDLTTRVAKKSMDVARGKRGAMGDIQQRWASNSDFKEGMKNVSNALRDLRDEGIAAASPEEGALLKQNNERYGPLAAAEKAFNQLMKKEANRRKVTVFDAWSALKLPFFLAKKAVQYPQTPSGSLRIGNIAKAVGESNIWEAMQRASMANDLSKE